MDPVEPPSAEVRAAMHQRIAALELEMARLHEQAITVDAALTAAREATTRALDTYAFSVDAQLKAMRQWLEPEHRSP